MLLGGGGETGQKYASRSRPGGLGCAKHLSPLLLHADKGTALIHRVADKPCSWQPSFRGVVFSEPADTAISRDLDALTQPEEQDTFTM
jgi:hypothetical protein